MRLTSEMILVIIHCLIHLCYSSCFHGSGPIAALARIPVDEAGLAMVQVGVSLEALKVGGLISYVFIQAVRAAMAEVSHGVPGSGGGMGCGGLWGEPCRVYMGRKCYEQNKENLNQYLTTHSIKIQKRVQIFQAIFQISNL